MSNRQNRKIRRRAQFQAERDGDNMRKMLKSEAWSSINLLIRVARMPADPADRKLMLDPILDYLDFLVGFQVESAAQGIVPWMVAETFFLTTALEEIEKGDLSVLLAMAEDGLKRGMRMLKENPPADEKRE